MLFSKNLLLLCLPFSLLFTACSKDDDQPTPQPQPQPEPVVTVPAVELDHIKTPTTLEDRNSDPNVIDYFANKSIAVSAELTIKPGVVIGFAEDTRLDINSGGVISAIGTSDKKIRFVGKTAQKGFWSGIMIYSNASANNFTHTEILHAGSANMIDGKKMAIALFGLARVSVSNTTISQSGGWGIFLRDNAILVNFAANNFSNNHEAPLLISANHVASLDEATAYTGSNGRNVVEVISSSITGASEVTWPSFADNTPIRFLGTVDARTGWKLKPGTIIEVAEDKQINIETGGYLNAVGTAAKKITITGVEKSTGSWTGLVVYTGSALNELNHVKLQCAGGATMLGGIKAAIPLFGTTPTNLVVRNSEISFSGGYGIHVFGKKASLNADVETSNTFINNLQGNVFYDL